MHKQVTHDIRDMTLTTNRGTGKGVESEACSSKGSHAPDPRRVPTRVEVESRGSIAAPLSGAAFRFWEKIPPEGQRPR